MSKPTTLRPALGLAAAVLALAAGTAGGADQLQWGQRHGRNMVSSETNLPETFDPATGENVRWVARMGTETYLPAIVA